MIINDLLNYIKDNGLKLEIGTEEYIFRSTNISCFIATEDKLEIFTPFGEVRADISDFKKLTFDSFCIDVETEEQFKFALPYLKKTSQYNVYLEDSKGKVILYLYRIHKEN